MNKSFSKVLWHFITSKTLAVWMIAILTALAVLSMIIPQVTNNPQTYSEWAKANSQLSNFLESFQLQQIFKSYIFLTITLVFTINLICCTIKQFYRIIKLISAGKIELNHKKYPLKAEIEINSNVTTLKEKIVSLLKQRKYEIADYDKHIIASKGKLGLWGATIFHVGLIIIILAGLTTNYFSMQGYIRVSEGEVFQETHAGYYPGSIYEAPFFKEEDNHVGYQLKLEKQDRFFKGKLLDYTRSYVVVGPKDGGLSTKGAVERGQPFKYQGLTFYHKDSGFSPELKFREKGKDIGATFFSLNTSEIGTNGKFTYTGDLKAFESEGYTIKAKFYPDLIIKENMQYDYDSMEMKNPALYLEIFKHNQLLHKGLMKKGQWTKFDDFELTLGETILWVGIDVVKDPGAGIMFVGFFISLLGLIILYGIVPKRILIELSQDGGKSLCHVGGYSRKYQLFFQDELKELVKKLKNI